ncbi:hypothetical protein TWF481_010991 [Arthrobotrys musiformis]|uniref:Uncharacterized protein n=1 Tax=Arthrobotrys musiformis TaxID=47236 RepID=A0AAV9VYV2_9PEZI
MKTLPLYLQGCRVAARRTKSTPPPASFVPLGSFSAITEFLATGRRLATGADRKLAILGILRNVSLMGRNTRKNGHACRIFFVTLVAQDCCSTVLPMSGQCNEGEKDLLMSRERLSSQVLASREFAGIKQSKGCKCVATAVAPSWLRDCTPSSKQPKASIQLNSYWLGVI